MILADFSGDKPKVAIVKNAGPTSTDPDPVMPDPLENALGSDLAQAKANSLIERALDAVNWFRIWAGDGYPRTGRIEMAQCIDGLAETLSNIIPNHHIIPEQRSEQ